MLEFFQFATSDFSTFSGILLLTCLPIICVGEALAKIILACRGIDTTEKDNEINKN